SSSLVFQAEDGIRYRNVTGVQTCALPILINFPVALSVSNPLIPACSVLTALEARRKLVIKAALVLGNFAIVSRTGSITFDKSIKTDAKILACAAEPDLKALKKLAI